MRSSTSASSRTISRAKSLPTAIPSPAETPLVLRLEDRYEPQGRAFDDRYEAASRSYEDTRT